MRSLSGSDEGEIVESEPEKATKSLPSVDGPNVDRPPRHRAPASRSPEEAGSTRSRQDSASSRRRASPRGEKRYHGDEHGDPRRRSDSRRYEPQRPQSRFDDDRRRSRVSYADLDYGGPSDPTLQYDDRASDDRYHSKRPRTRSRSPGYYGRAEHRRPRRTPERTYERRESRARQDGRDYPYGGRNGYRGPSESERRHERVSTAGSDRATATQSRDAPTAQTQDKRTADTRRSQMSAVHEQPEAAVADVPEEEPVDEASLIEQRRKRREAIKAKYRSKPTPLLVQALQLDSNSPSEAPPAPEADSSRSQSMQPGSARGSRPSSPKDEIDMVTPTAFTVMKDEDLANGVGEVTSNLEQDEPSAADYNPTMDMREDQMRNDQRHHAGELSAGAYDETKTTHAVLIPARLADSAVRTQKKKKQRRDDFDIFAEDDDAEDDDEDMFAASGSGREDDDDTEGLSRAVNVAQRTELDMSMLDDWDDPEGYYRVILGELLDGRYQVQANLGKGMFSGVVRAMDSRGKKLVAIKVIRSNETMKKAGFKEIDILQKLAQADPEGKKHIIRLERQFEHKGHLCMVFENLSINLREVLKKFGRDVGINLRAVRAYAQQIFLGLSLLRKCNLLHADVKPDNILVNESRNLLKICDLGSASDTSENEITPYLVSRFYRAPEIILGLPYDFAIDVWSVGCTLYELYTGKILFTGRTNNQMLRAMMECRGKFSHKMLRKAQFTSMHFDDLLNFNSVERDKITGKDVIKVINFVKPTRDLKARLLPPASRGTTEAELKELHLFIDLLDRCLNPNPEKRCTPSEALRHPFIYRAAAAIGK